MDAIKKKVHENLHLYVYFTKDQKKFEIVHCYFILTTHSVECIYFFCSNGYKILMSEFGGDWRNDKTLRPYVHEKCQNEK